MILTFDSLPKSQGNLNVVRAVRVRLCMQGRSTRIAGTQRTKNYLRPETFKAYPTV